MPLPTVSPLCPPGSKQQNAATNAAKQPPSANAAAKAATNNNGTSNSDQNHVSTSETAAVAPGEATTAPNPAVPAVNANATSGGAQLPPVSQPLPASVNAAKHQPASTAVAASAETPPASTKASTWPRETGASPSRTEQHTEQHTRCP